LRELKALDQAETEKERERERFAALALLILDGLPDALIVADRSGIIVMINKWTEARFGNP
jgi:signal transduction histidine kinase